MTETFSLCYVVTEMALNTVARVSLEDTVAYTNKVGHNSVTECQSSGTEGSTSVTEKRNSGSEESRTTEEHDSGTEVEEKFNWKSDDPKSEWIIKLESELKSPASYDERYRDHVMKLPAFQRKPEEHYTPQQWRFGLHNRDLQTSTTVASTTESEVLKISLAAACNLSDRWDKFCDNVVHDPVKMVLRAYGLHSSVTNFTRKEVQSLLTLDALTLLLVLSSSALPNSIQEEIMENFISSLEIGGLKISALLKGGAAYSALRNDLFLCENQIPMTLLKRVVKKCYFLQGKSSYSDTFLKNPHEDRRKEFLHTILKNLVWKMCIEIFVEPCSSIEIFSKVIDVDHDVGVFNDCAHVFACVYKILTTFYIKESSPATKSRPHEDETKESASDREKRLHATSFGDHSKVLDIPGTLQSNLEQPGNCELQMSTLVEVDVELNALHHLMPTIENEPDWNVPQTREEEYEKGRFDGWKVPHAKRTEYVDKGFDFNKILHLHHSPTSDSEEEGETQPDSTDEGETQHRQHSLRKGPLRSATDLRKAGLRIKTIPGMVQQVAFKDGCLFLPRVQLHDRTESYFRNLVMYEVFDHYDKKRHAFTDYLHLMSDLIKTPEDIAYLIDDCNVIRNLLGTHQNAFQMWDRLQSGLLPFKYSKDYRVNIVDPINLQCGFRLNVMRTEFYDTFCSKPWLAISVITGAVLLLATLIQTYVSVVGSDKMQPHFPRGG
jgi:hypothetical protein